MTGLSHRAQEWQIRRGHGADFLLSPGQSPRKSPLSSRISMAAQQAPFSEVHPHGTGHVVQPLSPVRATDQSSLMSLNQSLRLEDREEFSYGMGVGGSMALWQRRPGMPKPLTPRSRKKLIREARIQAAADELRRIEEAEAARRLVEERRRWAQEMERIRLQEMAEQEAARLAKEQNDLLKARTMMYRVMKGWSYRFLFQWVAAVPKLRRWLLREQLMDYLDEVEEVRSAKQRQDEDARKQDLLHSILHKVELKVALKRAAAQLRLDGGDDALASPVALPPRQPVLEGDSQEQQQQQQHQRGQTAPPAAQEDLVLSPLVQRWARLNGGGEPEGAAAGGVGGGPGHDGAGEEGETADRAAGGMVVREIAGELVNSEDEPLTEVCEENTFYSN